MGKFVGNSTRGNSSNQIAYWFLYGIVFTSAILIFYFFLFNKIKQFLSKQNFPAPNHDPLELIKQGIELTPRGEEILNTYQVGQKLKDLVFVRNKLTGIEPGFLGYLLKDVYQAASQYFKLTRAEVENTFTVRAIENDKTTVLFDYIEKKKIRVEGVELTWNGDRGFWLVIPEDKLKTFSAAFSEEQIAIYKNQPLADKIHYPTTSFFGSLWRFWPNAATSSAQPAVASATNNFSRKTKTM